MHRLSWIYLSLGFAALIRPCAADDARYESRRDAPRAVSAQEPDVTYTRTPEMWFYEQERIRYEDPKAAIRRRAELRAAQRDQRLAALKWYGFSNSRPMVNTTPAMGGSYSPYWGSNTYDPYRWRPYAAPPVVMRPVEEMRY